MSSIFSKKLVAVFRSKVVVLASWSTEVDKRVTSQCISM